MATTVGVKLDEATRDRLKKLARARQRSSHWLMREAIERYLDVEERYERERAEDEARWQRYVDTGAHVSDAEMTAWFDELVAQAAQQA